MLSEWAKKSREKRVAPEEIRNKVVHLRSEKKTIATLNGSFDLLHVGHLEIIYQASLQADILIVALNSDNSIKQYKSQNRPIIHLEERMQMIAALYFVDYVTYFEETTPISLLEKIQPDVHVNGSDYGQECIEADTVHKYGGKIHIASLVDGFSTSQLITKIKKCVS